MHDPVQLLQRAALDGHTVLPRAVLLACVPLEVLEDAMSTGAVVADDTWVALESLATAEAAVADEVLGLADEGRLALVLGDVPAEAQAFAVENLHLLDLEQIAARLQEVPDDARVVLSGDPDALPGLAPGAVLRDLLEWGQLPVRDLRTRSDRPLPAALERLPGALGNGQLPPPDPDDRSLVVTACTTDPELVHRVVQLVTDSIPRVFDIPAGEILVVTPLRRSSGGQSDLQENLAAAGVQADVRLPHEIDGRRSRAVVACFPGAGAGVLSRALVYTSLIPAEVHLSVVSAAGRALPQAVSRVDLRRRRTRLGALLAAEAMVSP